MKKSFKDMFNPIARKWSTLGPVPRFVIASATLTLALSGLLQIPSCISNATAEPSINTDQSVHHIQNNR